jgi:DNA-binding transcriptional ArsR family regulator
MSTGRLSEEALLEAVADSSRRQVLDLVLEHGEITPTALAAELPFTRQAVAKHLAVLDRAGLVASTRQGREVRYSVRPEHLDAAVRAMEKVAARWDARLETIKRMAEASAAVRRGSVVREDIGRLRREPRSTRPAAVSTPQVTPSTGDRQEHGTHTS